MEKNTGSRPVPDPTELTTNIVNEAKSDLRREIGEVGQLFRSEIAGLKALLDERFGKVDVQFKGVQTQLLERDTSIGTALQAAEKAVGKSENGFTKQIDEMGRTTSAVTGGMNKEIDDMKRRLGAIEGRSAGVGLSAGVVGGIISGVIAFAAVVIAAIAIFSRSPAPVVAPVVLAPAATIPVRP